MVAILSRILYMRISEDVFVVFCLKTKNSKEYCWALRRSIAIAKMIFSYFNFFMILRFSNFVLSTSNKAVGAVGTTKIISFI